MIMLRIVINESHCKGCGLCVAFCPKGVLGTSEHLSERGVKAAEVVDEAACVGCMSCVVVCPDVAIEIFEVEVVGSGD